MECDMELCEAVMNKDKPKGATEIDWHMMTSPSHGSISHQASHRGLGQDSAAHALPSLVYRYGICQQPNYWHRQSTDAISWDPVCPSAVGPSSTCRELHELPPIQLFI
ncbi:hypothetical protein DPEC_G00184920 [Dallia pectoralis]|uniref:Uncharacterized protein n=1 Tax=Dallia pectoralis TaxID=75939 RepID=A0ACC2GB71_DALPE|nr:hypothetical protein DPEC_G00184920 [Dallia pectoralis]